MTNFRHRARAVGIVVDGGRVLASHVSSPLLGETPQWLWPGGRVEGVESLEECAVREVREETGLEVSADRLIYVYQMTDENTGLHNAEFFFLCNVTGGQLGDWNPDGGAQEDILDSRFLSQDDTKNGDIWPQRVTDRIRDDLAAGFPGIVDLGHKHFKLGER